VTATILSVPVLCDLAGTMKEATTVTRWTRRLLVGAIALLVPALAGCEAGLNAPTLQFHPASIGVSTVANGITIDDAFVLGPALDTTLPAGGQAGVFLSLSAPDSDQLTSVSAKGTASSVQLVNGPVTLNPYALVDLNGQTPQIVLNGLTNPLSGGGTVKLTLNFTNAGPVTLTVPVEPDAYDFATYSPPPAPTAAGSASPLAASARKHKAKTRAKAGASPAASSTASASPSATP
jgi:copper(I)-binding protein